MTKRKLHEELRKLEKDKSDQEKFQRAYSRCQ